MAQSFETLALDLHFAFRILLKNRGQTAMAVIALALGAGANTAVFSVVNSVLLRPLPFPAPDCLVTTGETDERERRSPAQTTPADFQDWRKLNHSFVDLAAQRFWTGTLTGSGAAEHILGAAVTASFFSVLGVQAKFGRAFVPEDEIEGHDRVVVLSDALWRRQFNADPSLIGREITLNMIGRTVVGVMPPGFRVPLASLNTQVEPEMWVPIAAGPRYWNGRGSSHLLVIGRLKPNISLSQARADMALVADDSKRQHPEKNQRTTILVEPLKNVFAGGIGPALAVLQGAVGFLLLLVCANLANLRLAQGISRQKEIAIRMAVGGTRLRILRQLITESLLLSIVGSSLGVVLARWVTSAIATLGPADIPGIREVSLDTTALTVSLGAALAAGFIFGIAPAVLTSKSEFHGTLRESGRTSLGGTARARLRSFLVLSEVALAVMLLTGAGLLMQAFFRLRGVDPGFQPANVLTAEVEVPGSKYPDTRAQSGFFDRLIKRVQLLPGVKGVGAINYLPLSGDFNFTTIQIETMSALDLSKPRPQFNSVSPGYFRAMGIRLLRGRYFLEDDTAEAPKVLIISEAMARSYWASDNPIGKRIKIGGDPREPWRTVVGVVGDERFSGLDSAPPFEYYLPYQQDPWDNVGHMVLVVQMETDPLPLTGTLRRQIQELDPDVPFYHVRGMEQLLSNSMAQRRFSMLLLGTFAFLALVLAGLGIYGVMAYVVSQRTQEIGIRMALGAQRSDVLKLVLRQGALVTLSGLAVGMVGALALTRFLAGLLYEIRPTDPLTFAAVSALMIVVALAAVQIPAARALRVEPVVALRYE